MAAVQCKIDIPAVSGLQENTLTVGREFILVCDGEFPRDLQQEKLQFVLKPEQKYQVHLLGFEFRSPTTADIKVTAYQAAEVRFEDLQLTDGVQTVSLGQIQYKVETVLDPQAKTEPFGPIGPATMSVPFLYWALLGGAIFAAILASAAKFYRMAQRRAMLEKLKEHDSAMTPLAQFHQGLRRLQRQNSVFFGTKASKEDIVKGFEESQQIFRMFLTRFFRVPAFEWGDRLVLRDIKKYHRSLYKEHGKDLKKLLIEYRRGQQDKEKLLETDLINITTQTRLLVEKIERFK